MRLHPAFASLTYAIISVIITDNESVWSEEAADFRNMLDSHGAAWADLRKDRVPDPNQPPTVTLSGNRGVVWGPVRPARENQPNDQPGNAQQRVRPEVIRGAPNRMPL